MSDDLVSLTIDGVPLRVPKGTLLVEAAKKIKQEIPVYCYHTKLGPAGLCRVCLVEIEGMPKLQIGCNTPVAEGMVVHTQNEKVNTGRGMVLELLLVNHPLDCPICDKGGECDLQDYAMAYGRGASDVADPKESKPKGVDLGPTIVLDEERCVVCQRCVRFDDIIAAERQLVVKDRGVHDIIATATGDPYRHHYTGNVTELCPVGALTSKTYRFKSRPWDLDRTQTSCTQCSVGCQQFVDVRYGNVLRTMSVESDDALSDGWLCDRGRYNIGFYSAPERLTQPLYKKNGEFVQIGWDDAFALWGKAIQDAKSAGKDVGAVGGGRLLNEEAYTLAHVFRAIGVENLDWRAGQQRIATPPASGTYEDLERAAAIVTFGQGAHERAPVMWLRAIKAVTKHGAKLIRIAPRDAAPSFPHTDVANVAEAIAALPAEGTIAVMWDGVDTKTAREFRAATESRRRIGYIASEQPNSRGAEAMGMVPKAGALDTFAMFAAARDGSLAALSLFGVNPMRNFADPELARAALLGAQFVVVSELFMTETAQLADLVLPAKGVFEKSGTTMNLCGELLPANASLAPPVGTLSDLEMLVGLAQQFDVALPTVEAVDAAVIEAAAHPPAGLIANVERDGEPSATRRLWDGGGTTAHDDRIAHLRQRVELVRA
ncbi:MAG TPA: molybdopterin-dependent oxidoreductase [Candidatus Baltobacteraceae bacterium]|nr:molybdopterin-dependent oxidoreductase [Candidatus Baltobacteraceae bacterium]